MNTQSKNPFKRSLSFKPLMDASLKQTVPDFVSQLLERVARSSPLLFETIDDPGKLDNYKDEIRHLMSLVFPVIHGKDEAVAAFIPFSGRSFYASPLFQDLFLDSRGNVRESMEIELVNLEKSRMISAYLLILETFYDIRLYMDSPAVLEIKDPESGLSKFFSIQIDTTFVHTKALGPIRPLSDAQRHRILEILDNPDLMAELLPPSEFEFHGFTIVRAIDVTVSEILSALERDLIDQQTIISNQGFSLIQSRLESLFRCPGLVAGISALQNDEVLLLNSGAKMTCNCIFQDSKHVPTETFAGSPWETAVKEGKTVMISDITRLDYFTNDRARLFPDEVRSLIIVPMIFEGTCIGTFSIGSPEPERFSSLDRILTHQLQPLFTMAVKKALSELEFQIQKIIKEKCTAIHPSLEWRFRKAATNHLTRIQQGKASDLEPIVFKNVYSLFGVSDIRGSSKARNNAIQQDLKKQLDLALDVLRCSLEKQNRFILQELAGRIESRIANVQQGISTGDELKINDFLKKEVEPLFEHLENLGKEPADAISRYMNSLDSETGAVYEKRKEFEQSVTALNDALADWLSTEEASIQAVSPHYFEMHRTDGIDYQIYIGQSLMETGTFNKLLLKDLRIWQIRLAAGLAWQSRQSSFQLDPALETAHLVLIQNAPVSIRFRVDEKRFDVDGAYDTRQEIIKSRIDKALVKGTGERLTQPGKIAIVYFHSEEAQELKRHLKFLKNAGYLCDDVETLELERLPDVYGLMALRVSVDLESPVFKQQP